MLNRVWLVFFLTSLLAMAVQLFNGHIDVLSNAVEALFASAKLAAEIALGLVGVLSLWMGLMRIGEKAGVVGAIAFVFEPLLRRLMPEVPNGHPAFGSMTMNLTANIFGLDNAATPLGLKAMQDLQSLNPVKTVATNAQILFLVLNTSSVTLVPVTVFLYRAQQGAAAPADIFLPILIATSASTLAGLLIVAFVQRLSLLNAVVLGYGAVLLSALVASGFYLMTLTADAIGTVSTALGNGVLLLLVFSFVLVAGVRKVAIYDEFIEGAKAGFNQSIQLIPYLLAMLLAIGLLRASGALDYLLQLIASCVSLFGFDTRFVDAMPTALMKPFSGSGARAMMLETMAHHGVDSFAGRLAAIFQGSTETTFYVLAVYFGSVGIRHGRHALACGLTADFAGISAAIAVCYWFYG
ncbi:nucleoside recognition domain-containing protein [Shewanella xiamenensis]|uniref:Nucleoside recognition domain-containing protein n=1 Tax=Shewanella xiamenensis TaxID=332186 RepID=A0AAE4PY89_9GAMM|nr:MULTISPECIES: spore maturation protein [Shewanella]KPN75714.1 membrane protein [Shewanella sp. Sh95]MCT8858734.1 spore maturation protein [Shewanella xiamenensis]MDH1626773.1 spore maturation protein [Shewanella xiamenensis]MDV5249275.1 nucleoside recognition domain-containing protein [Shewanella xiamenensis]MDV5390478.1 nucleoside recognition domain-containing protein [Shewanella xiamenensis]